MLQYKDAFVKVFTAENNVPDGIYFQDERMKRYFSLYPDLLLVDATYKLNDRRMPLFLMLIVDGNGESQIIALFLLKSENYDLLKKMIDHFKEENENSEQIRVILSDKNFADRKVMTDCFPIATLQLCRFHVLQSFRREVTCQKRNLSKEKKIRH